MSKHFWAVNLIPDRIICTYILTTHNDRTCTGERCFVQPNIQQKSKTLRHVHGKPVMTEMDEKNQTK